jgi:hypothetical protein
VNEPRSLWLGLVVLGAALANVAAWPGISGGQVAGGGVRSTSGVSANVSDSLRARREIRWAEADSVMQALLQRPGYSITRYQGNQVVFRAGEHVMLIRGNRAQVARDSAILVGDTIEYNDSTQVVLATGDTLILRDPARGPDDVVGRRLLRYDIRTREGVVYGVTTAVESGERWVVHGGAAAFKGDTTAAGAASFYARNGWLTSCQEAEPHYHFAAGEIKLISKNVLVARPAILYIADIPVFWLPFVFQDVREGRRSGVIPPRFGFTEIVRNSPSYRRTIENLGYYFAINDYVDAQVTMDWRSDARSSASDPGWLKFNGLIRYRVRDLFASGELGVSHHYLRDGTTNQQYSLTHQQEFSQRTRLSASLNYVTNTTVQRNTAFNPFTAMQTIASQLNYQTARGPWSLSLGGSQRQYPGRAQIDRTFPTLNVTSQPIAVGEWLTWRPAFSLSSSQSFHIDQAGDFGYRYFESANGVVDSTRVDRNTRSTVIRFDTPVEIFRFSWRNAFSLSDRLNDFPERRTIVAVNDTSQKSVRVFRRTYVTSFDWETSFSLPAFSQGRWNISPSVQIQKVDGRSGLLVRTERTGGRFVAQPLRPAFGLGIAPTLYKIYTLPFGPFAAIRHSINPTLSYQYTPRVEVSDEFLAANGDTRVGYLGGNRQNVVSLGLNTVFEAKMRPASDTIPPEQWRKIRLLSIGFTTLAYDFERARVTGSTGLTNRNFGVTMRSDLLPGFDFGVDWSLFQGDPVSDTATFKPYREAIRGSLSLSAESPLVRGIARLLGLELPAGTGPQVPQGPAPAPGAPSFVAGQPIAGSISRIAALGPPSGRGWQWNLTYSSQRQRPPRGSNVVVLDPLADCQPFRGDPLIYEVCVSQRTATTDPTGPGLETTRGGTYFVTPAQSNVQSTLSFHLTEKWGAQWNTTYDFTERKFASHVATLTREMHDWNAVFAFMRAPNGNFAFNFHIALKAQPDIKFDYDRRSYPRGYTGPRR